MKLLKKICAATLAMAMILSNLAAIPVQATAPDTLSATDAISTKTVVTSSNFRDTPSTAGNVIELLLFGTEVSYIQTTGNWAEIIYNGTTGYISASALGDEHDPYINRIVTGTAVSFRAEPSSSGELISTLTYGTLVEEIITNGSWSKVLYNGTIGYISYAYLEDAPEVIDTAPKTVVTNSNFRDAPSTAGNIIEFLSFGTEVSYIETTGNWAKIIYNDTTGYITASALGDEHDPYISKVITGTAVSFRAEPSSSGTLISTLTYGTLVEEVITNGSWSKVLHEGTLGYISCSYLEDAPSPEEPVETINKTVVTSSNFRDAPSTSGNIIQSLSFGTEVSYIETTGSWAKIIYNDTTGYITASALGDENDPYISRVTTGTNVAFRAAPSSSGPLIKTLAYDEEVEEIITNGSWSKILYDGTVGYISASLLQDNFQEMIVTGTSVALREEPSSSSNLIDRVPNGTILQVYSEENGWARVLYNGSFVYISCNYLQLRTTTRVITGNSIPLRASASEDSEILIYLPFDSVVEELKSNQVWAKVVYGDYTGYISINFIETPATLMRVTGTAVAFREEPSSAATLITRITNGETLSVYSIENNWAYAEYNGQLGYISASYLETVSTKKITIYKETMLYETASENGNIIEVLPAHTEVEEISSTTLWAKVIYNGKTGYIPLHYIQIPVTYMVVTGTSVAFRESPSSTGELIMRVPNGTEVQVFSIENNWAYAEIDGQIGYISATYLADKRVKMTITGNGVNFRDTPEVDGDIIDVIYYHSTVYEITRDAYWAMIEYNGQIGYVSSEYVDIERSYKLVTGTSVAFRESPSSAGELIMRVPNGTEVQVFSIENGWAYGEIDGQIGYISTNYLADKYSTMYVKSLIVYLREKAYSESDIVAQVLYGTEVKVYSTIGNWAEVMYNGELVYVSLSYLSNEKSEEVVIDDPAIAELIQLAKEQLGKPYVWGANGPDSFDCSSFTQYIFYNALGIELPRTALEQSESSAGLDVSIEELEPGDLLFFDSDGEGYVTHVGMYIGNGEFIHASQITYEVIISPYEGIYAERFVNAKRFYY